MIAQPKVMVLMLLTYGMVTILYTSLKQILQMMILQVVQVMTQLISQHLQQP